MCAPVRTLSWMVAGALLGVACATTPEFACAGDADCVLGSTPGICTEGGHCAYPDDDCPSGYSFPAQTPGMAGECVPGDAATSGTGDDDDDDAVGTSSDGDSSADGESTGDRGSTGDSGSTSSPMTSTSGDAL